MAGAYCKFCDQRCFVLRIIPDGPRKGASYHLATCQKGMVFDLEVLGHTHLTALNPVTEADAVEALAREMGCIPLVAPAPETMRATVIRVPDPDVHEHIETLTDGDGRQVPADYDYGDLLLGMYRLTRAVRDRLRELLDETDARAAGLPEDAS